MVKIGVNPMLITAVVNLYKDNMACVKIGNRVTHLWCDNGLAAGLWIVSDTF